MSEHDDELADFGGEADVAVVAITVAMHVASIALLDRSAGVGRKDAARAAKIVRSRLRRRGSVALSKSLDHSPGTRASAAAIAKAAVVASARLHAVPRAQLDRAVGHDAATEVLALGAEACTSGGRLGTDDLAALAAQLEQDAELVVGIGRGHVFPPSPLPEHELIEVELAHLWDPRRAQSVTARDVRRHGTDASEVDATLVTIVTVGEQELRVLRDGQHRGSSLVLDQVKITFQATTLDIAPIARDRALAQREQNAKDWASVQAQVRADAVLRSLVGDLYTKPGFGGSVEVLRALVELAPLIHKHEDVAREFVGQLPSKIDDPMTQIVHALRAALERH